MKNNFGMRFRLILILIVTASVLTTTACTHSQIMKECSRVEGKDVFVCKTVKPWE